MTDVPVTPNAEPASANSAVSSEDKVWSLIAHLGLIVVPILAPLIAMLTRGKESPFVREHAVEALNFQIVLAGAWVISFILTFVLIGACLMPLIWIAGLVFGILAAIKAYAGQPYRYPVNLRLVK